MIESNIEFLERILKIYKLPYTFEKGNKSKHWQVYNYRNYDFLNLLNFRRKKALSHGLDDQYKVDYFFLKKVLNQIDKKFLLDNLLDLNIGNLSNVKKIKGKIFDYNKIIHICWIKLMIDKIPNFKKINNYCEIGQGYGSFTDLILKNTNSRVLLIDLPEANLMTSYYLKNLYPNKKFFLYDQYIIKGKLSYEDYKSNEIIILPPEVKLDEKIKFELIVSARSFMEMKSKYVKNYFNLIHNTINDEGFFLNINRYQKNTSGENIIFDEYPYAKKTWEVILSQTSFNQDLIHFLIVKKKVSDTLDLELQEIKKKRNNLKSTQKVNIEINFLNKTKIIVRKIFGNSFLNFLSMIMLKLNFDKLSKKIKYNDD